VTTDADRREEPAHPSAHGAARYPPGRRQNPPFRRCGPRSGGGSRRPERLLIGRDGEVIKRYEPPVLPADIKADLENYL
jgi:hypothetical protein